MNRSAVLACVVGVMVVLGATVPVEAASSGMSPPAQEGAPWLGGGEGPPALLWGHGSLSALPDRLLPRLLDLPGQPRAHIAASSLPLLAALQGAEASANDTVNVSSAPWNPPTDNDWSFLPEPQVERRVTFAMGPVTLGVTMPGWPLPTPEGHFGDELPSHKREAIEYALSVAYLVQADFCMDAWDKRAGESMVLLRQTHFFGCCSHWYTTPMSFSCHPLYFQGDIDFSSLFHEMGHNFTLNFPDQFRIGGKTDGPTNGIMSEFLANVFQHATVHEILAHPRQYGLSSHLGALVKRSGEMTLRTAKAGYDALSRDPGVYTTYDAPDTPMDEAMSTFLAAAFVFEQHAKQRGEYRHTVRRLMTLLRHIQPEDVSPFRDPHNEPFRASLMAAMQSYAHQEDMRQELRSLGFPVDDGIFERFMARGHFTEGGVQR